MISNETVTCSKKANSIDFSHIPRLNLADREYGLLKTRVSSHNFQSPNNSNISERVTTQVYPSSTSSECSIKVNAIPNTMNRMPSSTPHPAKGVELDPKILFKRMQMKKAKEFLSNINEGSLKSFMSNSLLRSRTSYNPSMKSSTKARDESVATTLKSNKKVSLELPKASKEVIEKLGSRLGSKNELLSFQERRRLFDWGEYAIAKNGKKMSEILMAEQPNPVSKQEQMDFDNQNARAMESFINKNGYRVVESGKLAVKLLAPPSRI